MFNNGSSPRQCVKIFYKQRFARPKTQKASMCKTVFAYGTGSTGSFRETGTSPSPGEEWKVKSEK